MTIPLILCLIFSASVSGFLTLPEDVCPVPPCSCSPHSITCKAGLTAVPPYIGTSSEWKGESLTIYLSGNVLHHLPNDTFLSWNNSEAIDIKLSLQDNGLSAIDAGAFRGLGTTITNLDLRNNALTTLPEALSLLYHLKVLYVSNNLLMAMPLTVMQSIGQTLNTFEFSLDSFQSWPTEVKYLSHMQVLIMSSNTTTIDIPDHPFHSNALTDPTSSLLKINSVDMFPDAICDLPKLHELQLTMESLNASIPRCSPPTALARMNLIGQFTEFPDVLVVFPHLTYLSVQSNQSINFIPDNTVPVHCGLSEIDLSGIGLRYAPIALQSCTNLNTISLKDNEIEVFGSGTFGCKAMPHLNHLDLSGNPLEYIASKALAKLTGLQSLNLHGTKVTSISYLSGVTSLKTVQWPSELDCTCENLAWLKTHSLIPTTGSHCNDNITVTVDSYRQTTLPSCP